MNLYSQSGIITTAMDKTNVELKFQVPQGIKSLTVKYSYNPKVVDDKELAYSAVVNSMKKYDVGFANPEAFMPVKNLVTLSFDECGEYRGACHRQPNEQVIFISDKNSTPGILNRSIRSGEWKIVLNVHFVGCDVNYNIEVEGEVD